MNVLFLGTFIATLIVVPQLIDDEITGTIEDVETLARDLSQEALDSVDEVIFNRIDSAVSYVETTGSARVKSVLETLRELLAELRRRDL